MAKARRVKSKVPSVKSRAARRATSPSIDVDKSIKSTKPPTEKEHVPAVLAARSDAGISKKKKQKPQSRQKRLRQQKGVERADIVFDKLERKVDRSKTKAKAIKERASDWEELNTLKEKRKLPKKISSTRTTSGNGDMMRDIVETTPTNDTMMANDGTFDALEDIT